MGITMNLAMFNAGHTLLFWIVLMNSFLENIFLGLFYNVTNVKIILPNNKIIIDVIVNARLKVCLNLKL